MREVFDIHSSITAGNDIYLSFERGEVVWIELGGRHCEGIWIHEK
jgi:hypothetical protein